MTVLHDVFINIALKNCVDPWEPSNINPASLDLRLGNEWLDISRKPYYMHRQDSIKLYPNSPFKALYNKVVPHSKRFPLLLLATTYETITLPADMYAMVKLKTTPCREGLGHPIADWVDPGYSGKLTLMLHAFKPITLHYKQRVCQLVIGRLDAEAAKPYNVSGHYMHQTGPTPSWREGK